MYHRRIYKILTRITAIMAFSALLAVIPLSVIAAEITGIVVDEDGYGLAGVNVIAVGLDRGAATDLEGNFSIPNLPERLVTLRASMLGFKTSDLEVDLASGTTATVRITLPVDAIALQELTFEIEREHSNVGHDGAERLEVLTTEDLETRSSDGGLLSALSGGSGLDTKPCALCGAAGIGMQGLDPSYTEITVDGLPVLSGLGALYGLDGIAVSDLKQVEVSKGSSRGEGGAAAMGGAVNLVTSTTTMDMTNLPTGSVSLMGGETGRHRASGEISFDAAGAPLRLSGSYASEPRKLDRNHDGLTDAPSYDRFNLSATQSRPLAGGTITGRVRGYAENRFAGETRWTEDDRGSATVYGRDINTTRLDAGGRFASGMYPWGSWSADAAYAAHHQDSYYGSTRYDARQTIGIARFSLNRTWNHANSTLFRGQFRYEDYLDNLNLGSPTDRIDRVPGLLVQHQWSPVIRWNVRASVLSEHYDNGDFVATPRASLLYSPSDHWTFIGSAGTGYRTVTLFSLDKAAHAGFDNVIIPAGLEPERSAGGSLTTQYQVATSGRAFQIDLTGYYTRFENKVVLSFGDAHTGAVQYANAADAFTRGGEMQASLAFNGGWTIRANAAYTDVQYQDAAGWHREELRSLYTAGLAVQHDWELYGLTADVKAHLFGPQALPEDRDRSQSPTFVTVDAGIKKAFGRYSIGLQLENLTDYVQPDPVVVSDAVSGQRIDAAMIYGPQLGRTALLTLSADFGDSK